MTTYQNDNIIINVIYAPVEGTPRAFDVVLLLVDEAQGTGNGLGGDRFQTYNSVTDAQTAQAAGDITVEVLQAVSDYFSQSPRPRQCLVGRVDTHLGEAYAGTATDGFEMCIAAGASFYGLAIDKRTDAEILLVSAAVEAHATPYLFALQSDDADWLTANFPAALTALENRERTIICWHDTDTEWADFCWLGNRLFFDPDEKSAAWPASLAEVKAYATALTAAEKGFAYANHVNLGGRYGTAVFYVDPGHNAAGRGIHQIVTGDWFKTRLEERLIVFALAKSARGEKILIGIVGQTASPGQVSILAIIQGLLKEGEAANHFVAGQVTATALPINSADIIGERLRFESDDTLAENARRFTTTIYLGTDAVID